MHRIGLILILFFSVNSYSQETFTSKNVEDTSYKLYTEKKWKELTAFGNKAVAEGFDYYYLRMRIGIAYYEQKNYRAAQKHFRKASRFNSSEDVMKEYLYYCYLYNEQYDHAKKLTKQFSPELAKKLETDRSPVIDFMMLEGGVKSTSRADLSNAYYGQYGIGHHIGKNVSFFHAITLFDQKGTSQSLDQKQYYLSASVPVKTSWLISPAFHYLNKTVLNQTVITRVDTIWKMGMPHVIPPPWAPPLKTNTVVITNSTKSQSNYYIGSMEIKRSISRFDMGACATISNIDSISQTQGDFFVSYFPFGNNKLILTSTAFMQKESVAPDLKYAFLQSASVSLSKKINLSANFLLNQAHHLNEMNGYLANNSSDLTTSRITLMGNFILSRHINAYVLYQVENKEQNVPPKGNPSPPGHPVPPHTPTQTTTYSYNNFFAGLKIIL